MPPMCRAYTAAIVATTTNRQASQLLAHLDALTERLRPRRRPVDRGAPDCTPQELFALTVLGRRGRLTMTDLAAAMQAPLSTASRIVDRLVKKGLVARTPLARDRRVVHVAFSPRGERINQFVVESRQAAAETLLKALPARERAAFLKRLARLLEPPSSD
jgi:DNA-binding MarR family transcriptional regulator